MTEGEVLFDAILVGRMDTRCAPKSTPTLCAFRLQQMAFTRARTQYFAARSDFETLRYGLFCLNAFGTSYKLISSKRARNIRSQGIRRKGYLRESVKKGQLSF